MAYNTSSQTASGTITSAQVKALHASPVTIIPAPAAGKMIMIINGMLGFIYGGSNVFTAAAAQTITAFYSTTQTTGITLSNAAITASVGKVTQAGSTISSANQSIYDGLAINIYNSNATEITGNAAGDNSIVYFFQYYIVPS